MQSNQLKKLIKKYVKECLNEILADKYLREMRSEPKKQNLQEIFMPEVRDEDIQRARQQQTTSKPKPRKANPEARQDLMKKLGIKDSVMESVFRDTYAKGGHEKLDSEKDPAGTISEKAMKEAGIMDHNWEAYIKN